MQNLDRIALEAASAFAGTDDPDALEQIKARYLGKSGQVTELLKGLSSLSPEEKKSTGAAINRLKTAIETALNARREAIRQQALEAKLAEESLALVAVPAPVPAIVPDTAMAFVPTARSTFWVQVSVRTNPPAVSSSTFP